MGWLNTYGPTNKVDVETREWQEDLTNPGGATTLSRTVTMSKYKYVGMTQATAETCQAAVNDPGNGVTAVAKKAGRGGNWNVDVTSVTFTGWS